MKNFIFILIGLIIGVLSCLLFIPNKNITPVDTNEFYQNEGYVRISGIINYTGNNVFLKRYTKSIILFCNLLNNNCTYVDATYVNNGNKMPPQIYPNWDECNIIEKQNQKIVLSCENGFIGTIDTIKNILTFTNSNINYTLKW